MKRCCSEAALPRVANVGMRTGERTSWRGVAVWVWCVSAVEELLLRSGALPGTLNDVTTGQKNLFSA